MDFMTDMWTGVKDFYITTWSWVQDHPELAIAGAILVGAVIIGNEISRNRK